MCDLTDSYIVGRATVYDIKQNREKIVVFVKNLNDHKSDWKMMRNGVSFTQDIQLIWSLKDDFIKVIFLPQNAILLLQPMNHNVI